MKNWSRLLFNETNFAAKIRQLKDISCAQKQLQVCFPLTAYNSSSVIICHNQEFHALQ
jgi:hypothetical protein